jgi:hypothetical protein
MKHPAHSHFQTVLIKGLATLAALAAPAICSAANVVMTASDAINTTSFNASGTWSPAGAPSAGNTYSTLGYLLRSPTTAGSYTFAGNSLTVGGGSGGGVYSPSTANNNALIFKASGITLTVNNLILDGSQIRDGNGDGSWTALNGNIQVTANGGAFLAQDTNFINSAISGSGTISIGDNGSGSAARVIVFTSGSSTFNGNISLAGTIAARSRLTFASGSLMNFAIGANGVNNKISGVGTLFLDGNLNFDLSGADNTVGDTWTIISGVGVTYGSNFGVQGFSQNGSLWDATANGVGYQFDTASGILSVVAVPEPSTFALAGMGLAGLLIFRRRA